MKAVLMSIRPKWVQLIERGEKTTEVRKTAPLLKTPLKVFIYCSRGRDRLLTIMRDGEMNYGEIYHGKPVFITIPEEGTQRPRRMVIGEFTCNAIFEYNMSPAGIVLLSRSSCLTEKEILKYAAGRPSLYGWKISDCRWYRDWKNLSDFGLTRPPQSWQYVEVPDA